MANAGSEDLLEVRRIVFQRLQGHPARIYLFGSHARGKAWRHSDIDIAVLPLTPLPPGLLNDLRDALEESLVLSRVDLVDLSTADPGFRKRVEQEAILWTD